MNWLIFLYGFAALMLAGAIMLMVRSQRQALLEKTRQQFSNIAGIQLTDQIAEIPQPQSQAIVKFFWRAGIEPKQSRILLFVVIVLTIAALTAKWVDVWALLVVPVLATVLFFLWLQYRVNKRTNAIISQLPLFLDQTIRALSTGKSMESALTIATEEARGPVKMIFQRILRANYLGEDLGVAIQQMADLYRVQELYLVAMAIRINRVYGSGVKDLLNNIVRMIHDREAARRELRAMTGETRVTAWVLGSLPILIAGYILMVSPDYIMTMWEDDSGQMVLMIALIFQLMGVIALWRMLKSI